MASKSTKNTDGLNLNTQYLNVQKKEIISSIEILTDCYETEDNSNVGEDSNEYLDSISAKGLITNKNQIEVTKNILFHSNKTRSMTGIDVDSSRPKPTEKKSKTMTPTSKLEPKKNKFELVGHPFSHLVSPNFNNTEEFKKHLLYLHKGLYYCKNNLKAAPKSLIESKKVKISERPRGRFKTLIMDLDETLVHKVRPEYDDQYIRQNSDKSQNDLLVRPGALKFLNTLKKHYEIIVYTAGSKEYADAVCNILDPKGDIFNSILSFEHCLKTRNGLVIKNIEIIKERSLKEMIMVDNLSQNFGLHINNGIPIISWYGNKDDMELLNLIDYLIAASYADDVREFNMKKLNLEGLLDLDLGSLGF